METSSFKKAGFADSWILFGFYSILPLSQNPINLGETIGSPEK